CSSTITAPVVTVKRASFSKTPQRRTRFGSRRHNPLSACSHINLYSRFSCPTRPSKCSGLDRTSVGSEAHLHLNRLFLFGKRGQRAIPQRRFAIEHQVGV